MKILVELDEEEFTVGFRWLLAVDDEPSSLTDYCFSWMRSLARHGSGSAVNPLRAEICPATLERAPDRAQPWL